MIDFDDDLPEQNDDLFEDAGSTEEILPLEMTEPEPVAMKAQDLLEPDIGQAGPEIGSNLTEDLECWHLQSYDDTSAVAVQEFILSRAADTEFSEEALRQEAIDNGWYFPGGGTPLECVGNLLEAQGLEVERHYGGTLEELDEGLNRQQAVMVAVGSDVIWEYGVGEDRTLSDYPGLPGQDASHTVQVIGIDHSDPANPVVILNDPSMPGGQGMQIPANQFLKAWDDSGRFTVSTTGHQVEPKVTFGATDSWGRDYWPSSGQYISPNYYG